MFAARLPVKTLILFGTHKEHALSTQSSLAEVFPSLYNLRDVAYAEGKHVFFSFLS